jgi:hypothetical protein
MQRQEGIGAGDGERLCEGNKALEGTTPRADLARNKASRHGAEESVERLRKPEGASDAVRQAASSGSCHVRGNAEGAQNLMGGVGRSEQRCLQRRAVTSAARSQEDSEGERKPMGVRL